MQVTNPRVYARLEVFLTIPEQRIEELLDDVADSLAQKYHLGNAPEDEEIKSMIIAWAAPGMPKLNRSFSRKLKRAVCMVIPGVGGVRADADGAIS